MRHYEVFLIALGGASIPAALVLILIMTGQ
jgi:hypothetical protein